MGGSQVRCNFQWINVRCKSENSSRNRKEENNGSKRVKTLVIKS